MSIEIKVPTLPESVADATVATWYKQPGDFVNQDEVIVDIETDKVVLEVPAPQSGILKEHFAVEGETVADSQLLAMLDPVSADASANAASQTESNAPEEAQTSDNQRSSDSISPSVRRTALENEVNISALKGTGPNGRLLKEDVLNALNDPSVFQVPTNNRVERRVPMTRLRKRIAERLLDAKNSTAMLTTFNEVNMQPIKDIRKKYGDSFETHHGIRLGFMSFYVKAVVEALKRFPGVNASLDGNDLLYHDYFDISMAVSTPRGLVTPVLRDCQKLSFAEIESEIRDLAIKGRDGKLTVDELTGGTFTITNGGVFGSLMSTPIINPPQSAILGMHKIQDRPVVIDKEIKIAPMMYIALSYDHRVIDGKESVSFLALVKDFLEEPTRLLLDV